MWRRRRPGHRRPRPAGRIRRAGSPGGRLGGRGRVRPGRGGGGVGRPGGRPGGGREVCPLPGADRGGTSPRRRRGTARSHPGRPGRDRTAGTGAWCRAGRVVRDAGGPRCRWRGAAAAAADGWSGTDQGGLRRARTDPVDRSTQRRPGVCPGPGPGRRAAGVGRRARSGGGGEPGPDRHPVGRRQRRPRRACRHRPGARADRGRRATGRRAGAAAGCGTDSRAAPVGPGARRAGRCVGAPTCRRSGRVGDPLAWSGRGAPARRHRGEPSRRRARCGRPLAAISRRRLLPARRRIGRRRVARRRVARRRVGRRRRRGGGRGRCCGRRAGSPRPVG